MSPAEVMSRLHEQGRKTLSRRRSYGWEAFQAASGPLPILPGLKDAVLAHASADFTAALRKSVDAILSGEFRALDVAWPKRDTHQLFPASVWRLDPVTGQLWPGSDTFCFDVAYRHEHEKGDIKYVWELNRLQFLQPLAVAVALDGHPGALAAIEACLVSWMEANPPYQGVGWNSGIEVALRAISVALVTTLCGDVLSEPVRSSLRPFFSAHLFWIRRFPSRFSSANNHAMAELMAEFILASLLTDQVGAAASVEQARHGLEREALLQILPDGVGAEQSPTYGAFTAEMLLLAAHVARGSSAPLALAVETRLSDFAEFVTWLAGPDGRTPAIGDDDEGRVFTLCGEREATYPASVATAIARYREAPTPEVTLPPELRDGFFGRSNVVSALAPTGVRTFPEGGCTVIRERQAGRQLHLVMDHGPLGYLSIAAHGHADANAIWFALDGVPIFVDPGTYLYHSGGTWRDWFRGTRAHNTLTLGGADQSLITGPFNWGHKASACCEDAQAAPNWSITARHDGYRKRFGVDHQRRLSANAFGFDVIDRLLPEPCLVTAEVVFQLAPEIHATLDGQRVHLTTPPGINAALEFMSPGRVELRRGDQGCDGGWVSPHFGGLVPAYRVAWQGMVPSEGLTTRVIWDSAEQDVPRSSRSEGFT